MRFIKNIHGTDGVRGLISKSEGGHPLYEFISTGHVSPPFFCFYSYVFCLYLLLIEKVENRNILIVTDNRDPSAEFVKSACLGCAYAGFDVTNAGILPTPAVPLLMKPYHCAAGIMLTASHNPATYHGIKLFLETGLKMHPDQEEEFTRFLYHYSECMLPDRFDSVITEQHNDAVREFVSFHKEYIKSALPDKSNIHLYLDCANGAFSETAKTIFSEAAFSSVTVVNEDMDGEINSGGGAAEFEQLDVITRDEFSRNKHLSHLNILNKMFGELTNGSRTFSENKPEYHVGLVFDGDGDRCIGLIYHPFDDAVYVFTGDKMVALIIKNLIHNDKQNSMKLFTTIESDLMMSEILPDDACSREITSVGDKWLTYKMDEFLNEPFYENQTVIGYEDSGHIIFPIPHPFDKSVMLCGNGLIGGVAFITAFNKLANRFFDRAQIHEIMSPYESGIKETMSIYGTQKQKLTLGQPESEQLKSQITGIGKKLKKKGYSSNMLFFPAEPNTIYFEVSGFDEQGALFIRNSGTENKTSVYIRCGKNAYNTLSNIRDDILLYLHLNIKDYDDPSNVSVFECLKLLHDSPEHTATIKKATIPAPLLKILIDKEKLLRYKTSTRITLTDIGHRLITQLLSSIKTQEETQHSSLEEDMLPMGADVVSDENIVSE